MLTSGMKLVLFVAIFLWASAFVGIRAGLQSYSPGALALLRFAIASICMIIIYNCRTRSQSIYWRDAIHLLLIGAIGIGLYNISLNSGEVSIPSGPSSFLVSQSPLITMLFAILFLGERITLLEIFGISISISGVLLISCGLNQGFKFEWGLFYILIATITGGLYSVMQKPLLQKYHAIDVTAFVIWGGTLILLFYVPNLFREIKHASNYATLSVIYLGIFPATIAYLAWSYVLSNIQASKAVAFLYLTPVLTTFIGWLWLREVPSFLSFWGGIIALTGVFISQRYKNFSK